MSSSSRSSRKYKTQAKPRHTFVFDLLWWLGFKLVTVIHYGFVGCSRLQSVVSGQP